MRFLSMRSSLPVLVCCILSGFSLPSLSNAKTNETDGTLSADALRCQYLVNPLGVDDAAPRLSWIVRSQRRADRQTAYQILVASTPDKLRQDKGDLWDSGVIRSDTSIAVVYEGKPLNSYQPCWWKVRVWDAAGAASPWSQPATWSMGMLKPTDWKATWIGYDKPRQEQKVPDAPFGQAKWIWFSGDKPMNASKGSRVFLSELELPKDIQIAKAQMLVVADDAFKFNVNGRSVGSGTSWQKPTMIDLTRVLRSGVNYLRVQVDNGSAGAAGLLVRLVVDTEDGKQFVHISDASWRATDSPGANWHKRAITPDSWPAVQIVGDYGCQPWGKLKYAELMLPKLPLLRRGFDLSKRVRRATVCATALGLYDLYINGQRVSDDWFNPGWTDYAKRVYYRQYDVTKLIRDGSNAMGAILADGWYSGYIGWGRVRDHYGKKPRFAAQLRLEFEDGTTQLITTDAQWKAATGPILEADFLMGETYDARCEQTDWSTAAFDDSDWKPVDTGAELNPVISRHPGPPVTVFTEVGVKKITEPVPGVYVLDMGQNFAGVARLTVRGKPGQRIQLRFAERLNPDGTIYTENLRGARAIDTYTCRGSGREVWEPRFTFHGFQYVEITGLTEPPTKHTVVGRALSSATPVAGHFECSDSMLNQLHSNIYWTQRANFIDIPTDCPQRDERLGWTGDAQVYVRTATLNTDVQAFFRKWLVDLEDAQRDDGQFPCVAPVKIAPADGGPAWADAGVICPWTIYEVYGDVQTLARHYAAMKRFIAFCKNRCTPELLPPKKYHCFGDWLNVKADTPKDVIFMAYFAQSTKLTAQAAKVLGKPQEAAEYNALFQNIKKAFNKAFVGKDGRITGNTQTCYVLAIRVGLLDDDKAALAAKYLVDDIKSRNWHLSTGFIGTKDLMLVLAKIGRNDVAYRLLQNETFPSWGFSIRHGATSIWERWDGWTPEKGFQTPGMNSFAHYSFGAVYQWIVENVAGIRSDGPSYSKIIIAPEPGGTLQWANTDYASIHGKISSHWRVGDGQLVLEVVIPANTTATIKLPVDAMEKVRETGEPLADAEGIQVVGSKDQHILLKAGSGTYRFTIPWTGPTKPSN